MIGIFSNEGINISDIKIYLEFDERLQQVIADNQLYISDILKGESIKAKVMTGVTPYQDEDGARPKELVTIILASSVLIGSISIAISKVLNDYYHKPIIKEYYKNDELRDGNGNILCDKEGNPIFKKVKTFEMLQPREMEDKQEYNVTFKDGIVIKFNSESKK